MFTIILCSLIHTIIINIATLIVDSYWFRDIEVIAIYAVNKKYLNFCIKTT